MASTRRVEAERISADNHNDSASYEIIQNPAKGQEVNLIWEDIRFQVGDLEILKGVSGISKSSELTAIMGSSGSGKTSLLSILSNQIFPNRKNKISGTVRLNEKTITELDFQSFVKYVMQQDILLPTLTPRETLTFAARLKVGKNKSEIKSLVNDLLEKLKISNVSDNLVGNELIKGLSGGEKKRLCIGLEMISDPPVLLLDEPTSGLDSYTAKIVIGLLKETAKSGKTVLMTIHQPSQDIYEMIDSLILMIMGHFVYQGPAAQARLHFDGLGFVCQEHTPPPDHFMRILYIKNIHKLMEDEKKRVNDFITAYKSMSTETDPLYHPDPLPYSMSLFKPGFFDVFSLLLFRSFVNAKRNPMLFGVKIVQAIFMGTVLALLFRDLGYGRTQIENRKGLLFFVTINTLFFGVIANTLTFPVERPIMIKDYKENLYGVTPYYLSKFVAELPIVFLFSFFYSIITYFATDLNLETADHYFIFFGIHFLVHLSGMCLGNLAGALSVDFEAANVYGPTIAAPFMLFAGFFSKSDSLASAFEWIKYISPFSRGYEAFILNELDDLPYDRDDYNGTSPLSELGFGGEIWHKCGALLLICLGASLIALVSLKILAEKEKR
jgi:ABC-type multidrug transport system ATPase subunit